MNNNFENLSYKEIVAFLLDYINEDNDNNTLAEKLIKEFGSFHSLLNANTSEIMSSCNLNMQSSMFISLMPHICRKYLKSKCDRESFKLDSAANAAMYLNSFLAGLPFESFYMICFDREGRKKDTFKISEGITAETFFYIEDVIKKALLCKAKYVILGHNHPGKTLSPSNNDIEVTKKIADVLDSFDIGILDHIIICGNKYYSFRKKGLI